MSMFRSICPAHVAISACLIAAPAAAQDTSDPLECGIERLSDDADYPAKVFDNFMASLSEPNVRFLRDPELNDRLVPAVEVCTDGFTEDQADMAMIALGMVGQQLLIEGRRRFEALDFDPDRLDSLFVPAFNEMPLDALNLMTFRPPEELREPAFALRDELVASSGKDKGEITALLTAYMTGLVGKLAAQRVIANAGASE